MRSRLYNAAVGKAGALLAAYMVLLAVLGGCGQGAGYDGMARLPPMVEQWRADVEACAEEYGVAEYVELLLAIMAQESGGDTSVTADIMQCSASAGLPDNSISDPLELSLIHI